MPEDSLVPVPVPSPLDAAFTRTASAVLRQVRLLLDIETAYVTRKSGDDYVILRADDDALGVQEGFVTPWDETFCAQVMAGKAPAVTPCITDEPALAQVRERLGVPVEAWVSVPLTSSDGKLLGTLCAASLSRLPDSARDQLPMLELLANMLGSLLTYEVMLQNQQREVELTRDEAERDPLTGLGNRRMWDRVLEAEDQRCRTYELPAAIVVLDADRLKEINDQHGHHAGDAVLHTIGRVLGDVVRSSDFAARLGGDEFGLLLPGLRYDEAAVVCERITALLRTASVSVSAGVAARASGARLRDVWVAADTRMYVGKYRPAAVAQPPNSHLQTVWNERQSVELLARAMSGLPDANPITQLVQFARVRLGLDVAMIGEIDGQRLNFCHVQGTPWPEAAAWAKEGVSAGAAQSFCQQVIDAGQPLLLRDTLADPRARELQRVMNYRLRAYAGAPIVLGDGEVYGTLCCFGRDPAHDLTSRDADLMGMIASAVASHIEAERVTRRREGAARRRIDELLRGDDIGVDLEPVVDVGSGAVLGYEAVPRFPDHDGDCAPAWFEVAAAAGLTDSIELLLGRYALAALNEVDGFVALNVSASTVLTPGFRRLLDGVDLARVVVEISEREKIPAYGAVLEVLQPYRAQGLRLAVDNVLVGRSDFQKVLRLEPDVVKCDLAPLADVRSAGTRVAVTASLETFARMTGALVVAIGIETPDGLATVKEAGITVAQGALLGRPAPLPTRSELPGDQ